MPALRRVLQSEPFDVAMSTGAAIAAAALPLAALARRPGDLHRERLPPARAVHRPAASWSGCPGIDLRTPARALAGGRWGSAPSILADFRERGRAPRPTPLRGRSSSRSGTIRGYRFDSVIDALLATGLANEHTVWQLGDTRRADALPGTVHDYLSPGRLRRRGGRRRRRHHARRRRHAPGAARHGHLSRPGRSAAPTAASMSTTTRSRSRIS